MVIVTLNFACEWINRVVITQSNFEECWTVNTSHIVQIIWHAKMTQDTSSMTGNDHLGYKVSFWRFTTARTWSVIIRIMQYDVCCRAIQSAYLLTIHWLHPCLSLNSLSKHPVSVLSIFLDFTLHPASEWEEQLMASCAAFDRKRHITKARSTILFFNTSNIRSSLVICRVSSISQSTLRIGTERTKKDFYQWTFGEIFMIKKNISQSDRPWDWNFIREITHSLWKSIISWVCESGKS